MDNESLDSNNLEIIESKFTILNEKLLESNKLNTKVDVFELNHEKRFLKIDSTSYRVDNMIDESELDLSCFLELKYTNEHGKQQNLCHVIKCQVFIKFVQPIYFRITELKDLKYLFVFQLT